MVKEYLQEKVDAFKTEKERLLQEKERLDGARNRLHESVQICMHQKENCMRCILR